METEKPESIQEPIAPPQSAPDRQRTQPRRLGWRTGLALAAVIVVLTIAFLWRGSSRAATGSDDAVTVAVARVGREDLFKELTIPAEFRPYLEVELHAKVSGYLDWMNVDIGDKVKSGDLLAMIEVPELLDQLHYAVAVQRKAEADFTNAELAYTRLVSVNKEHPNLVAQQELDTAQSRDLSAAAAIAAAKADVEKYQTLAGYTKITAPFDGVVTKRYADPGALIQAGTASDTQSMPLVRISDNYRLRLDFPVSVDYVQDIRCGDTVDVRVESLEGGSFAGKISRFADKVDTETRTMIVEIEVDNPKLELLPGMYANVILKVQRRSNALVLPSQAVAGDNEKTVYVVNGSGKIEVRPVTLGLETPDKFEVTSGLKAGELVLTGSRSEIHPGQKVQAKMVEQLSIR
jgi:RND family efflux transporter MFP subunit